MEVIPLPLELSRGVDLVSHDPGDGLQIHNVIIIPSHFYWRQLIQDQHRTQTNLLNILHPLGHLVVAHVVDILDKGIVLLPERHLKEAKQ